jgi:hypothetical protein
MVVRTRGTFRIATEGDGAMKTTFHAGIGAGIMAIVVVFAPGAFAEVMNFRADLKGSSEVPANDSQGWGLVTVSFDSISKKMSFTVKWQSMKTPPIAAHFHGPADAKSEAGVVVPMKLTALGRMPSLNTQRGEATLTDAQAADLTTGKWYFDFHTEKYPHGELRGQVLRAD